MDYKETEVYNTGTFKILECQRRGYKPFYELLQLKSLLWIKYWKVVKWSDKRGSLVGYIERWEEWEV